MPPISVLLALPRQEPLMESAMAFREKRAPKFPMRSARIPKGVRLDETFSAVPIASRSPDAVMSDYDATKSEQFVVRGTIDARSLAEVPVEIDGAAVFADPEIEPIQQMPVNCGQGPQGNAAAVKAKLQVAQLAARGLDGTSVAIVIVDTGINRTHVATKLGHNVLLDAANSWNPAGSPPPGNAPVHHGSMCAFDALLAAPKATLLDFPVLTNPVPGGGSRMSGTLGAATQAYSQLVVALVTQASGGIAKYKSVVISNSWGMFHPSLDFPSGHPGRYCDNPRHPFNLLVALLATSNVDILFAAGNCGAQCPDVRCQGRTTESIMGANAHADVLTVAGCDTNDVRVGYSSQGPAITGMPQQKPDLTAYTQFLGSEAFGPGAPDGGTSAACPVAAGVVAAFRTKLSNTATPPANLFVQLRATARQVAGPPGWNADFGYGILDTLAAANSLGL